MSDVEIKLGGRVYNLRPTFGAMREIEAQTKSSCATLYGLLVRQEMHAGEAAVIVYYGMQAAGENATDWEAVGNRIFEERVSSQHIRDSIAAYLFALLYTPAEAKKKFDGEWRESEEITSQTFSQQPTASGGHQANYGDQPPESSGQSSKPNVKNPTPPDADNPVPE